MRDLGCARMCEVIKLPFVVVSGVGQRIGDHIGMPFVGPTCFGERLNMLNLSHTLNLLHYCFVLLPKTHSCAIFWRCNFFQIPFKFLVTYSYKMFMDDRSAVYLL